MGRRTQLEVELAVGGTGARAAIVAAFPGAQLGADGRYTCPDPTLPTQDPALSVAIEPTPTGTKVRVEAGAVLHVPFWGFAITPLLRRDQRIALRHAASRIEAAAAGIARGDPTPVPAAAPPRRMAGFLSVGFTQPQVTMLASAAAAAAFAGFGGALYGQNTDFIAEAFDTTNDGLGLSLAVTRFGILLSLVATALADRRGRRRLLIVSVVGVCLSNLAAAAAPTLVTFTTAQTLTRGFVNSTLTVAGIMAIEEAPEGARAFAGAMMGLAAGFGFSMAVVALPIGDLGDEAWRVAFVVSGLAVCAVPRLVRLLPESRRYASVAAAGITRGSFGRILATDLRRRLALLALLSFAGNVFSSPSAQLMNRFLGNERGFSGLDITVFRTVTTALPGLIGLIVAIRIVEGRGRKPVALVGLVVGTALQMVFFLSDGATLWLASAGSLLFAAGAGLALGTLSAELFPTEVRATSNAVLLVIGVLGSATGLVLAGQLDGPFDGLGPAIALLGVAPLAVAVAILWLPESAGRRLDDVSPTDAAAPTPFAGPL